MSKKTLVIGGSIKPERYSNKAIKKLVQYNQSVVSIGIKSGKVEGVEIETGFPKYEDVHTVTLYVGMKNQAQYYDYLLGLNPKRIIFNPGTENPEFYELAKKNGVETIEHCTLIMLSEGSF